MKRTFCDKQIAIGSSSDLVSLTLLGKGSWTAAVALACCTVALMYARMLGRMYVHLGNPAALRAMSMPECCPQIDA
jgi:hypothetical protein